MRCAIFLVLIEVRFEETASSSDATSVRLAFRWSLPNPPKWHFGASLAIPNQVFAIYSRYAQNYFCKGALKAPEISTPDRHPKGDRCNPVECGSMSCANIAVAWLVARLRYENIGRGAMPQFEEIFCKDCQVRFRRSPPPGIEIRTRPADNR